MTEDQDEIHGPNAQGSPRMAHDVCAGGRGRRTVPAPRDRTDRTLFLSRLLADPVLPLLAKRLKPIAIGNERSLVTNAGMGQIRRGPAAVVGMSAYLGTRAVGAFCSSRRPGAFSCAAISESSNISTRPFAMSLRRSINIGSTIGFWIIGAIGA